MRFLIQLEKSHFTPRNSCNLRALTALWATPPMSVVNTGIRLSVADVVGVCSGFSLFISAFLNSFNGLSVSCSRLNPEAALTGKPLGWLSRGVSVSLFKSQAGENPGPVPYFLRRHKLATGERRCVGMDTQRIRAERVGRCANLMLAARGEDGFFRLFSAACLTRPTPFFVAGLTVFRAWERVFPHFSPYPVRKTDRESLDGQWLGTIVLKRLC